MLREKLGIGKVVKKHEIAPLKVKKKEFEKNKTGAVFFNPQLDTLNVKMKIALQSNYVSLDVILIEKMLLFKCANHPTKIKSQSKQHSTKNVKKSSVSNNFKV